MGDHGRIYLDNAATSFPKPAQVTEAMTRYATELGASPGRGSYRESVESAGILTRTRDLLRRLINGESAEHVVFTLNTTDALSMAIKGVARARRLSRPSEKVHFVATAMDHNSVLRPLNELAADGVATWTRVPVDPETGIADPDDVRRAVQPDTALVCAVHASNVCGSIQPIGRIGADCRELAVPLLVDAAQSAGHLPIDVQEMNIDLLAVPGHKGLLGPLGTGALYLRPGMEKLVATTREGGTGSVSEQDTHPTDMPDRYEAGSHNTIGIAGLEAGLRWILARGIDTIREHETELTTEVLRNLRDEAALPGLRLLGPRSVEDRLGVFAFSHDSIGPEEIARRLEAEFGILSRAGIHCAPGAHETFGTVDRGGAVRLSFGPYTTVQDVRYACDALSEICRSAVVV